MSRLFSIQNNSILKVVNNSEVELNRLLEAQWRSIFPQYTFIKSEFRLEGSVRSNGSSGRIDILAFNAKTSRFVVFELKKDMNKNVRQQASDYKDFIEDNFQNIYLSATQKYKIDLPNYFEMSSDNVEIVIMSKQFTETDINNIRNKGKDITLIKYCWFENDLFFYDYINNNPSELDTKRVSFNGMNPNQNKIVKPKLKTHFEGNEKVTQGKLQQYMDNNNIDNILGYKNANQVWCTIKNGKTAIKEGKLNSKSATKMEELLFHLRNQFNIENIEDMTMIYTESSPFLQHLPAGKASSQS